MAQKKERSVTTKGQGEHPWSGMQPWGMSMSEGYAKLTPIPPLGIMGAHCKSWPWGDESGRAGLHMPGQHCRADSGCRGTGNVQWHQQGRNHLPFLLPLPPAVGGRAGPDSRVMRVEKLSLHLTWATQYSWPSLGRGVCTQVSWPQRSKSGTAGPTTCLPPPPPCPSWPMADGRAGCRIMRTGELSLSLT